jgi:hypothetical protein
MWKIPGLRLLGISVLTFALLIGACVDISVAAEPPADRAVRVLARIPQYNAPPEGTIVTSEQVIQLLFIKEPCSLPIEGAENMRRAWVAGAGPGCWYPTVDGGYVLISGYDGSMQAGARR